MCNGAQQRESAASLSEGNSLQMRLRFVNECTFSLQPELHPEKIDFRVGFNGLPSPVEQAMHLDPFTCVE